jgi:hypothetical protein
MAAAIRGYGRALGSKISIIMSSSFNLFTVSQTLPTMIMVVGGVKV